MRGRVSRSGDGKGFVGGGGAKRTEVLVGEIWG